MAAQPHDQGQIPEQDQSVLRQTALTLGVVGVIVLTILGSVLLTYQDSLGRQRAPTSVARRTPSPTAISTVRPPTPTLVPLPEPPSPTRLPSASPDLSATPVVPTATGEPPTATFTPLPSPTPTFIFRPTPPYPFCSAPNGWEPYIVQAGDTLLSLAWRYDTTVHAIVLANCLASQTIYVGQLIYLPSPYVPSTPTSVAPTPCGPPYGWQPYIVQSGDTLYSLAQRHGTTISAIMLANCLTSYDIRVGQILYLPRPLATATATPTRTATATGVATYTPTSTGAPTDTPTATGVPPTPTGTASPTDVPTNTPTATSTVAPTATDTATSAPTVTPSATGASPTATPTSTKTPASPTATDTPTPTGTPTLTETPFVWIPTSPNTATPTATTG